MAQHDYWVIGWYAVKNQISLNTRYIYLSIYLSIYVSMYLSIYLSIYLSTDIYIYIYR